MKMQRAVVLLFTALVLASCATAGGPAPEVKLVQTSDVPDLRINANGGLPMTYRLDISNPFSYDLTLTSIEVESVGSSGAYGMKRVRHAFDRVIPARSQESVEFRAWVYPLQIDSHGRVSNPVMLRGSARFRGPSGAVAAKFMSRAQ